jgi:7-cyano-7-deazaguanine synthase in queuosine biosynthesis
MSNAAHISVRGRDGRTAEGATHECVIGQDLTIDLQALQDYCALLLREIEHDLVVLCGAVMYADRMVPRRRASGWPRDLEVTLPVNVPEAWRQPHVMAALVDALEFVSGDHWRFNFVAGAERVAVAQSSIDFNMGPYVIVPFSDGLDSFLQWKLIGKEEPEVKVLRIQTSNRGMNERRNRSIDRTGPQQDQRLRLPVSAAVGSHPEQSYRTRTFLYFCMAALAAAKANTMRVIIGENGVGALGSSMIAYGNECPHRTAHPAYTRRLAKFLNALLGTDIAFEHPQVRRTKGEVLKHALALGVTEWECTNSCVRGPRDRLGQMACGACSGCLLRRTALLAAGVEPKGFFWENLGESSLDRGRTDPTGRTARRHDWDIVRHGAHAMGELAELAKLDAQAPVYLRAAWELNGPVQTGLAQTAAAIHRLVQAHAKEWEALLGYFGESEILNFKQAG